MATNTKYRIGKVAIALLVIAAVICDLIGLIPIAKDFTGTLFWIFANIYLWRAGVGFFKGKKLAAEAISWVAGLIPVIQEFPLELSIGIIAVIVIVRIEDRAGISVLKPLAEGKKAPSARDALNSEGRREARADADMMMRYAEPGARIVRALNSNGRREPVNEPANA